MLDKYLKFEEVKSIYDRMAADSCLVIYQHPRHLPLNLLAYGLAYQLRELLSCPAPVAITVSQVVFLLVAKAKKRQEEINQFFHEYVRSNLQVLD